MMYVFGAVLLVLLWCAVNVQSHPHVDKISNAKVELAVKSAIRVAEAVQLDQEQLNRQLYQRGIDGNQREHSHRQMMSAFQGMVSTNPEATDQASIVVRATQELTKILRKPISELLHYGNVQSIWKTLISPYCTPRKPDCTSSNVGRYRTIDGSCNNLKFPTWGMSHRDQQRYLLPHYQDDIGLPRMLGIDGTPLPSPRLISNVLHREGRSHLESTDSMMLMQFGQLLDHDIIDTPTLKGTNGVTLECCELDQEMLQRRIECFNIVIPPRDPHFRTACMDFVRSAPVSNDGCELGRRQQLNQHTSYIDASYLYGADTKTSNKLREHAKGRLKMNGLGMFFPADGDKCIKTMPGDYCMKSGDPRIHVVPGLASTQILMLREHNRIADTLGHLNPHWDDEILFQESRKIVTAINQHITYTEYLPRILGASVMSKYGLYSTQTGFNTVYNPSVDATTNNGFGAAAFRFGHSQIPAQVVLMSNNREPRFVKLETTFNRPSVVLANQGQGSDGVNRGLANDRGAKSDRFLNPSVRDKLFLDAKGKSFDLASLNIQRGRDHGIPGYNAWRKWCGLPIVLHFGYGPGGLVDMEPHVVRSLSKLYRHPDDIDLFSGGLAEIHVPGARVGPTFACIIGSQFREGKIGDRFWYESKNVNSGFSEEQLNQIKKQRLSSVMCHNMNLADVGINAFEIPSRRNPRIPCSEIGDIDFSYWKDYAPPPQPTIYTLNLFEPPLVHINNVLDMDLS